MQAIGLIRDLCDRLPAATSVDDFAKAVVDHARAAGAVRAAWLVESADGADPALALAADFRGGDAGGRSATALGRCVERGGNLHAIAEPAVFDDEEALRARFPDLVVDADQRLGGAVAIYPVRSAGATCGLVVWEFAAPAAVSDDVEQALPILSALGSETWRRIRAEASGTTVSTGARHREEPHAIAIARLDALIDNAPLGVGFWDRDLRCRRINQALADMNGIPPEDHIGTRPHEILPDLDGIEEIERAWTDVLMSARPQFDVEVSGSTPACPGTLRFWKESWYPVRVGDEVAGVGVLVRDVTEEKRAEQFYEMLLGIVGHDLRNPLAAILMDALVLSNVVEQGGVALDATERIRRAGQRMREIIELLLEFTQARSGGIPVRRGPAEILAICDAVADQHRHASPNREFLCTGEGDSRGSWDSRRLTQAISYLVDNALRHGPADTPVWIRWKGEDGHVVVEVENIGEPIPEDQLQDLFEPVRQGRPTTDQSFGLGLFLSQQIAQAHGGSLSVRSNAGSNVVAMRLPRQ